MSSCRATNAKAFDADHVRALVRDLADALCCREWTVARQHHVDCPLMLRDAYQRSLEANERAAAAVAQRDAALAELEKTKAELRQAYLNMQDREFMRG